MARTAAALGDAAELAMACTAGSHTSAATSSVAATPRSGFVTG
jgi:hypothetical protein